MDRMPTAQDAVQAIPHAVLISRDMVARRNCRRQLERLGFEVQEYETLPGDYAGPRVQVAMIDTQNPSREIQAAAAAIRSSDDRHGWRTPIVGVGPAEGYQERERLEQLGFDDFVDLRAGAGLFREVLMLSVPGWAEELDAGHRRAA